MSLSLPSSSVVLFHFVCASTPPPPPPPAMLLPLLSHRCCYGYSTATRKSSKISCGRADISLNLWCCSKNCDNPDHQYRYCSSYCTCCNYQLGELPPKLAQAEWLLESSSGPSRGDVGRTLLEVSPWGSWRAVGGFVYEIVESPVRPTNTLQPQGTLFQTM